jgi:uncharacterized membrane protein YfcA
MIELFTIGMLMVALLATVIVAVLRLSDTPNELFEKETWKNLLMSLPFSFVAAFLGSWWMIEKGLDLATFDSMMMLVLFALGGMGSVRGLMEVSGKLGDLFQEKE